MPRGQVSIQPEKTVVTESMGPQMAMNVLVNGVPVQLKGKMEYIFVDLFDFIDFDLSASNGRSIVTKVNGNTAAYMQKLNGGDAIEIYWEEK